MYIIVYTMNLKKLNKDMVEKQKKFRLSKDEHSKINSILEEMKIANPDKTEGELLCILFEKYGNELLGKNFSLHPEIKILEDIEFENICSFGNLKKTLYPKTNEYLWQCFSLVRPDKDKDPSLLMDGKNKEAIKIHCEKCQINWEIELERKKFNKQTQIFKKFGNEEISIKLYLCLHPYKEYIETNLGIAGSFNCPLKKKNNLIKNCIKDKCNHLFVEEKTIEIKQTEPYKKAVKELEDLR